MSTPNLIEFNRSVTAYCAVRKGYYLTCPQANGESKVEHSPHIKDATKGTFYEKERERHNKTVLNQKLLQLWFNSIPETG